MEWLVLELIILLYICGFIINLGMQISISNGYQYHKISLFVILVLSVLSWLGVYATLIVYGIKKKDLWFSNKMEDAPYLQYRFVKRDKSGEVQYPGKY